MKRITTSRRAALATLAGLSTAAILAACGGGGAVGAGGTGVGTAGALSVGAVTGFGSIIVNGVRFDDTAARIVDDNGNDTPKSDVQLGSMVEVESGKIDDSTSRATASTIRVGSEIKGPVDTVDATANTFTILGQTVDVKPTTVFDDALGTSSVAGLAGKLVEVHAVFDASTQHYVATRIEAEAALASFKLRGVVGTLDKTAKTFKIGTATISYAKVADSALPANFADGLKVRVTLETQKDSAGNWVATAIRTGVRKVDDHGDARVKGTVSKFTDATHFEVNGIPVDASTAVIEHGPVTANSFVEVRGTSANGTITATKVEVEDQNGEQVRGIELHGAISGFDATAKTFVLRGVTVSFTDTTQFDHGTAADLKDAAKVEVKGVLSADRKSLAATRIKFED